MACPSFVTTTVDIFESILYYISMVLDQKIFYNSFHRRETEVGTLYTRRRTKNIGEINNFILTQYKRTNEEILS